MNKIIDFNYFFNMFRMKFNEKTEKIGIDSLDRDDFIDCIKMGDLYATFPLNKERLSIYDEVLLDICKIYIKLTGTTIESEDNGFLLVSQILNKMKNTPYRTSFLWFINMFFKDYIYFLGKGDPVLWYTLRSSENSKLQVTLDNKLQIITCETINMNKVEEAKTMIRILSLEKNNQIGPVPNVKYVYRKDI